MDIQINDVPFKKTHLDIPDFTGIRQDVLRLLETGEWVEHVNQKDYSGGWQVLPLRGLACHRDTNPILQAFQISEEDPQSYLNYPVMENAPGIDTFLQQFCCGVMSARLMKLDPGAKINTHRDDGLCFSKGQARLHLSLVSDEKVAFTVADEAVPIREGELWYLNADEPHSVVNNSDTSRIHLVVDCLSNDWLKGVIGLSDRIS
ncbi:MAG: aspartyl/asparaginyl beta-hydroxylase domain-containing protein [Endozoicomonas sp.]